MEPILLYFLKSSGLLLLFFATYNLLLKKETFFNHNRVFLLFGLATSVLLPPLQFEKVIFTERKLSIANNLISNSNKLYNATQTTYWTTIILNLYILIVIGLIIKLIFQLVQLFKKLQTNQIQNCGQLKLIDTDDNAVPFSFFNYIVYNSKLYSTDELATILAHEKVHSTQKHSIDVLLATLLQVVFWFHPIAYLYKKNIVQNLEFIADKQATTHLENKKHYQLTLLKVISHQNNFSFTNQFYQSLIKKRIVMLNKEKSKKENLWKFGAIVPFLIVFVLLFQITVVAQQKTFPEITNPDGSTVNASAIIAELEYTKDATKAEMESDAVRLKKSQNVDLTFSKIKRNSKGEITAITIAFDDNKGSTGKSETNSDKPIDTIKFVSKKYATGKIEIGFYETDQPKMKMAPPPVPPAPLAKAALKKGKIKNQLIILNGLKLKGESDKIIESINTKDIISINVIKNKEEIKKYDVDNEDGVIIIETKK